MRYALFAAATAIAAPLSAAPQSDTNAAGSFSVVGAWEMVEAETIRPDGQRLPLNAANWGEHPVGIVMYGADGWMSIQISGESRPLVAQDDPARRRHPPERGAAIANSYYAYYGRYELDKAAGKVRHFIVQSLHPDETGQVVERRFEMNGDSLTLSTPPFRAEGEDRINQIRLKRIAPGKNAQTSTRK